MNHFRRIKHLFVLFLCVAVSVACNRHSATNEDGCKTDSTFIPRLSQMGITNPVHIVKQRDGETIKLRYQDDRLVKALSSVYGMFVIESNPLTIECVSNKGRTTDSTHNFRFYDAVQTEEGYIVSMEFSGVPDYSFTDSTVNVYKGSISASYNTHGHIKTLSCERSDQDGHIEKGIAHYTWKSGNIREVITDFFSEKTMDAKHEIYCFFYQPKDTIALSQGIYPEELNCLSTIPYFLWYSGLFGRPIRNIPSAIAYELVGDSKNGKWELNVVAEYDSSGLVKCVSYRNKAEY